MMQLQNGSGWPWRWMKKEYQDWMVATKRLRLAMEMVEERKATLVGDGGSYHTAQVGPGDSLSFLSN